MLMPTQFIVVHIFTYLLKLIYVRHLYIGI